MTCRVEGCESPKRSYGWCDKHYRRWRKHGDPGRTSVIVGDDLARFWSKVNKNGPLPESAPHLGSCWTWLGWKSPKGYGCFDVRTEDKVATVRAHRYSFTLIKGPIPSGMLIDHRCHNPACVNPGHLRSVTPKQNEENRSGPTRQSRSQVRGVYWNKAMGKWHASVGHHGKAVHVGYFDDLNEAERAVIAKRSELFTHNDLDRLGLGPRERAELDPTAGTRHEHEEEDHELQGLR